MPETNPTILEQLAVAAIAMIPCLALIKMFEWSTRDKEETRPKKN